MSDYNFDIRLSRDEIAAALIGETEQTAYVLATIAENMERPTRAYRDFCEGFDRLSQDQKDSLRMFCAAIVETLAEVAE